MTKLSPEDAKFIIDIYELWRTSGSNITTFSATEAGYAGMTFNEFIAATGHSERFREIELKQQREGTERPAERGDEGSK